MSIKSIELVNIMSHQHSLFEFPETGIINICGENSDGKSVLTRAVYRTLIKPSLHIKIRRLNLINRNASTADIFFKFYDRPDLQVHIDKEVSKTYYVDSETNIRVLVGEKVEYINAYVSKFGLSILNIYRSLQPLIFGTTSEVENYEALALAARDYVVEEAVEQFKLNDLELKKQINQLEIFMDKLKAHKAGLPSYDKQKELNFLSSGEDILIILEAIYDSPEVNRLKISTYEAPDIIELAVPEVIKLSIPRVKPITRVLDFRIPNLSPIQYYEFKTPETVSYDLTFTPLDITHLQDALNNLHKIQNQECPTCGRRLCDAHYQH